MTRRDLVQILGMGAVGALLPRLAFASDSGNSSQGSADSSAQSGGASQGSAAASQGSADSSNSSGNSSDSGDSSAQTGQQSANSSAAVSAIALTLTTTVGAVLLVLLILSPRRPPRQDATPAPARSPSALLLQSGFLNARRDLGLQFATLAESPAALDRLVAEAGAGAGPSLDALARAAGLPRARVCQAVAARWYPAPSTRDAARISLRILADLAPELAPDPDAIAETLLALQREGLRADPASEPIHRQIASWMGVANHAYVPVLASALARLPARAALHTDPEPSADALANALADAFPDAVADRIAGMRAEVARLDQALELGLFEAVPA